MIVYLWIRTLLCIRENEGENRNRNRNRKSKPSQKEKEKEKQKQFESHNQNADVPVPVRRIPIQNPTAVQNQTIVQNPTAVQNPTVKELLYFYVKEHVADSGDIYLTKICRYTTPLHGLVLLDLTSGRNRKLTSNCVECRGVWCAGCFVFGVQAPRRQTKLQSFL